MLDQIPDYLLLLYPVCPDIIEAQQHWILVLWQLMVHFLVEFSYVYKYTIPWLKKKNAEASIYQKRNHSIFG